MIDRNELEQIMLLLEKYNIAEFNTPELSLKRTPRIEIAKTYSPKEEITSHIKRSQSRMPNPNDIPDNDPGFLQWAGAPVGNR